MDFEKISINGDITKTNDAKISVLDQGLMYGRGAFETFRVSEGKVFLFNQHFDRLAKSLKALDIQWENNLELYSKWILDIRSETPNSKDARIRFVVTAGDKQGQPNVIIYLSYIDKFKQTNKKAQVLKLVSRHKPEYFDKLGFRIKSLDYSLLQIAKEELATGSDGILLSSNGYVAEGLTSNLFWTKEGKLYTPPLSLGILAGTVRGWIMENFKAEEKLIKKEELLRTDEIFLTSGSRYLIALSAINNVKKPGKLGPIYESMFNLLEEATTVSSKKL